MISFVSPDTLRESLLDGVRLLAAASVRDEGLPEKKKVNSITSSRLSAIIAVSLATLTTIYVFLTLPSAPSDLAMSREDSLVLCFSFLSVCLLCIQHHANIQMLVPVPDVIHLLFEAFVAGW